MKVSFPLFLSFSWIVSVAPAAFANSTLALHLVRDTHQRFHVEAEARVLASEKIVYETVRDYDHFTQFIPMLVVSHRTTFQGKPAIEQVGRARFLFFHVDARAILEEKFDPVARTLETHALDGDFSRFDSFWQFKPLSATETAIALRSEVNLKRWLPRWLERRQVRKAVDQSLTALLAEMQRRAHPSAN